MPVANIVEEEEVLDTTAAATAAKGDEKPAAETEKKPTTALEHLQQRREQIAARTGAQKSDATKAEGDATAPAKAGDAAAAATATKDKPATTSAEFYSDDEIAEIVESGKDLRNVDLKRVPPALRATLTKMQTAERKRNEKLTTKEQELDNRLQRIEKATAAPSNADTEDEDADALPDAEYDAIFKTKKGKAALAKALEDVYGVKPEDLKAVKDDRSAAETRKSVDGAIFMAQKSHPELKDDAFFDRVIDAIEADDEWKAAFEANRNNATIMTSVLKAATLKVKLSDAMSDKDKVAKGLDTIKREKEKQNAKPGSMAARASTTARPSKDMTTAEFVTRRRAQIRGQA